MDNRQRHKSKMAIHVLLGSALALSPLMYRSKIESLIKESRPNQQSRGWSSPHQGDQECARRKVTDKGQCFTLKFA